SRRAGPGSDATTRAGAGRAPSTRSATVADRATRASGSQTMTRRSIARDLVGVAVVAILGIVFVGSYATYRILAQGQVDEQRPADAIVVMGAAQYDGRPSPIFAARLDHAVSLYRAGIAPTLVVTGGKADGDRTTEAASARAYAIARGVPAAAILMEDQSRT